MFSRILKINFLVVIILMIAAGVYLAWGKNNDLWAQSPQYDLAGWLWSGNYGWIAVNHATAGDNIEYKVKIDALGNLSGYGWSPHVGWVCFGSTCGEIARLDLNSKKISGFARILSLDNDGRLHLGRGGFSAGQTGVTCYDCQPKCEEWTKTCDEEGTCYEIEPCLEYSETEFESCGTCFTRVKFDGQNIPGGGDDNLYVVGGSGHICSNCYNNCQKIVSGGGQSYRVQCDFCPSCELYGVNYSERDGSLIGWGWQSGQNRQTGAGWVMFHPNLGGINIVYPWLETRYGAIYTPGEVRQRAGATGANATYCIFANDINPNISVQSCEDIARGLVRDVEAGFPALNQITGIYRNALGRIDLEGLTKIIRTVAGINYNKYHQVIENISSDSWSGPSNGTLNNKIYISRDDLTAGNFIFNNGAGNQLGNGLIVVEGDLLIDGDIVYAPGAPEDYDLRKLASVAWIIKGDLIIENRVKNLAGAFIVLGNGADCQRLETGDYPKYQPNGCGVIFSGAGNESLTVSGLLIARAFDFRRTYAARERGAERIIYDGRLIANPPPGLKGFVEGLPIIRDLSF